MLEDIAYHPMVCKSPPNGSGIFGWIAVKIFSSHWANTFSKDTV